jgi:tetratricopeptide (TPR) repeat protein
LIISLSLVGRFEEAAACEAETTQLASRTEHVFTIASTHLAAVLLHVGKGDWAKAHSRIEQLLALGQTTDIKYWNSFALGYSALVLAWLGRADEAMARLLEAEQVIEQQIMRGNIIHVPNVCYLLGRACLVLGRIENAQRLAQQAMEGSARRPGITPLALWLLAEIARHPDYFDPEQSERLYSKAMAAAEAQGGRPLLAHCHLGLGRLYGATGKLDQAQEHLTTATTMYREMDMRFWLEQAEAEPKGLA